MSTAVHAASRFASSITVAGGATGGAVTGLSEIVCLLGYWSDGVLHVQFVLGVRSNIE